MYSSRQPGHAVQRRRLIPPILSAARQLAKSRYLAKLFGSNDTEAVVRLITTLLVLDPLAVLLTLAAAHRNLK